MATKFHRGALVPAALAMALLGLSACGKDEIAQTFTGGSSSKDKQPIPSTVNAHSASAPAPAAAAEPAASPAVAQPEAVQPQAATKMQSVELVDGQPIRENTQQYRSSRSRDPFRSLITDDEDRTDLVDLSIVELVGIVQGDVPFAIVEDADGIAYVLRKGDRVRNGRVVSIKEDMIVASQTLLGYTTTVQLKLVEEENESHG